MKTLILVLFVFLVGCANQPVETNYKSVLISPPDNLIIDCLLESPPNKEAYMNATLKEREKMLYEMSLRQLKNTRECNVRLSELRNWKKQQEAHYKNE